VLPSIRTFSLSGRIEPVWVLTSPGRARPSALNIIYLDPLTTGLSSEKPTAAFVLSFIGGVIVVISGLAVSGRFSTLAVGIFGMLGVAWGILMVASAVMLNRSPSSHVTWGVRVIVFSVLSWIGSFGGFLIGFLLGLIGGILGVTWHPSAPQTTQPTQTVIIEKEVVKVKCRYCGTLLDPVNDKKCPSCGAPVL
jgi:hypothetical protein